MTLNLPGAHVAGAALGICALSFLLGSIPFGLILGRLLFKSDIRKSGSGNIGAANALRTYGRAFGAAVLLLDALKGVAAVLLTRSFLGSGGDIDVSAFAAFAGCMAVAGHCYSVFLNLRGGKGVATWLGVVAAMAWPVALAFVSVWLLAVLPTRWASLGSLAATALSAIGLWFVTRDGAVALWAAAAAAIIFVKHRENIGRLAAGRENKIGFGKASRA